MSEGDLDDFVGAKFMKKRLLLREYVKRRNDFEEETEFRGHFIDLAGSSREQF